MKIEYTRNSFTDFERGQQSCYLLTNGLGGYSSMTVIGSNARNDHALLMAAVKAPNHRYHMITRLEESIHTKGRVYALGSQQHVGYTGNEEGYRYLDYFSMEYLPNWVYRVPGIELTRTVVMRQQENTVGIRYEIVNRTKEPAVLEAVPLLQFVPKGEQCSKEKKFLTADGVIDDGRLKLYYQTDAETVLTEPEYVEDLYYAQDAADGRYPVGMAVKNHILRFELPAGKTVVKEIIYSMQRVMTDTGTMIKEETARQRMLEEDSGLKDDTARTIARNCSQYVVRRDSVDGKSIIAGYPFFEDWGRDTMIAVNGCYIGTGQFQDAQSILRTFMQYCRKGLMPNLFPEGENAPMYNTVDASLLFIISVYEYFQATGDLSFMKEEAFAVIKEIIEWYQKGTDYHIKMDTDGLIMAGSGLEQVTWMDVRVNGYLPTPRHGKPVEVNALWYNALKTAAYFAQMSGEDNSELNRLADKVRNSFVERFWIKERGYLRDVISGTNADEQLRCNQIWAVSQPFSLLEREQERRVVDAVYEYLYTPYGLRTLSPEEEQFCAVYTGKLEKRDRAYHQGTVWTFPLGAYYLARLKVCDDKEAAAYEIKKQLAPVRELLREGCCGHLAEIYDGMYPCVSKGCFAQAWSMGEILRVYRKLEEYI